MSERLDPAISRIVNHEVVLQHFGYWPTFHDAEVIKTTFENHSTGRYSVTFLIAAFEMTNKVDERGYYVLIKHCNIELQFIGIEEIDFDGFGQQNVISDLSFEEAGRFIKGTLSSSVGLESLIIAEEAFVLSLIPTYPPPEAPIEEANPDEPMDSKNIYISSQHRLTNLEWSELIYVGLDHDQANEYKADKVEEYAHSLFDEQEVYVVIGRHDSHLSTLKEALTKISSLLKTTDVLLCNKDFTKAMKFYQIGVMSYGQKR